MIGTTRHARLIRFHLATVVHAIVNYSSYLLALRFLSPLAAFGIALVVGLTFQTFANIKFVFRRALVSWRVLTYAAYYTAYFLVNLVLLKATIELGGIPAAIAPAIIVTALLPVNFMLTRWIALREY